MNISSIAITRNEESVSVRASQDYGKLVDEAISRILTKW